MSNLWLLSALIFAGSLAPAQGQCNGASTQITGPNAGGEVKSPNLNIGGEYGKSANCSWKFTTWKNGKEYALKLTVEQLRLYVVKGGKKHCLGSYNLTMNSVRPGCLRYVRDSLTDKPANHYCNAYYSSLACTDSRMIQGCEIQEQTSFPVAVPVTYTSNGETYPGVLSTQMYFRIRYDFIECQRGCGGTTRMIEGGKGVIQSPNYKNDYGMKANCTWEFQQPRDGKKYALVLLIEEIKLYYEVNGANKSSGSLTIIDKQFNSTEYADPETINMTSCRKSNIPSDRSTFYPIRVRYLSDGTTDKFANSTKTYFKITYEYIECPAEPTTTAIEATTATTTRAMTTEKAEQSSNMTPTPFTAKDGASSKETSAPNTSTTPRTEPALPLSIVIGAGGGGLLLIIIIVVAVCLCKRRGKASSEETQDLPLNDAMPAGRNGNGQSEAADTYNTVGGAVGTNQSEAADTYDTVAEAVGTNQSEAADTYDTLGGVVGANQSEAGDTYDTLGGAAAPSQPQPELYATVSNPVDTPQSPQPTVDYEAPAYFTVGGEAETNQAELELYSVVSRPPNDPRPPEEDALYSAVSIRNRGEKNTIHYNKSMVDNVLYGTTEDM